MKRTFYCLIMLVSFALLCPASSYGQTTTLKPTKVRSKTKAPVPNVLFSKRSVAEKKDKIPTKQTQNFRPISRLSSAFRVKAIKKTRAMAGITRTLPPSPPVNVILTPARPKMGENAINTDSISSLVWPQPWATIPASGYIEFQRKSGSLGFPSHHYPLRFFFKTIPGKTYLCDIQVQPETVSVWEFGGAVSGTQSPSNGHLLCGFTATDEYTWLRLRIKTFTGSNTLGYFYRCELTRVD